MSTADNSSAVKAIALWEQLTEQAVGSSSYSFHVNGERFDLYGANKRVNQALEIADDVTTTLIIKTLSSRFADFETFTLADILNGSQRLQSRMDLVNGLNNLFSEPALKARHDEFFEYCEGAISHYRNRPANDEEKSLVHSSGCFVGLDAYYGIDKLTRLTVIDGPLEESVDPKVSQLIFAFDSIEDLVSSAKAFQTGFSLCAVFSEYIGDSYFVMVVRNGERTLILSDKGNYTHPLQESRMRSRNDRYNMERIDRSHFPYSLLNIHWADSGRRAGKAEGSHAIAENQNGLRILGSLTDLRTWDLLWLHLFMDQCRHRYFDNKIVEPMLALGSMIRLDHPWSANSGTNLPAPVEFEVPFVKRSSSELTTDFMVGIEPEWAKSPNPNLWMEERFAALVPDESLYFPAKAIEGHHVKLSLDTDCKPLLARLEGDSDDHYYHELASRQLKLVPMQNMALASTDRVVRDAYFLARHNQALVIERVVDHDFNTRRNDVLQWWYNAAAKNLPNLIDGLLALDHDRFQINVPAFQEAINRVRVSGVSNKVFTRCRTANSLLRKRTVKARYLQGGQQAKPNADGPPSLAKALRLECFESYETKCAVDSTQKAQLFISLDTSLVFDLMLITGMELDEIPVELHTRGIESYVGNSILDRIDPLANLKNPWDSLKLSYVVPVSLAAFKQARKKLGLATPRAPLIETYTSETAKAYALENP